jgi:hypothetical protein
MRAVAAPPLAFVCLLSLLAPALAGEEIVLRPRRRPGDAYRLSLSVATRTEAASRAAEGRSSEEDVRLLYNASVVVLEVDAAGRPVRERHDGVRLTFERPGETGSLFGRDASYEVRRGDDGDVRLYVRDRRVDREVEKIVAEILASQLEHGLEARLIDPGRPVAVGESWELDPALARRFLDERGVRVLAFAGAPSATLERGVDEDDLDQLAIRYSIPIAWCEPTRLPANARAGESEGRFEGLVRLASGPGEPASRSSRLRFRVQGITGAASGAWSLERSQRSDQRVTAIETRTAGAQGGGVAERALR